MNTLESVGFAVPENIFNRSLFLLTDFSMRLDSKKLGNVRSLRTGTQGFPFSNFNDSFMSHF